MKCTGCEAYGEYGCRAGFTSIIINGELGCLHADRVLDAFHFNQVKDKTVTGMTVYPSGKDHKRRAISRADNIRAMTDDELAEWLSDIASCKHCPIAKEKACSGGLHVSYSYCGGCWLEWLRQEADNG